MQGAGSGRAGGGQSGGGPSDGPTGGERPGGLPPLGNPAHGDPLTGSALLEGAPSAEVPADGMPRSLRAGSIADLIPPDRTPLAERMVRMSQIGNRTNLMAIDAVLRAVPRTPRGYADAALETAVISRRVARAAGDLSAFLQEAGADVAQL